MWNNTLREMQRKVWKGNAGLEVDGSLGKNRLIKDNRKGEE